MKTNVVVTEQGKKPNTNDPRQMAIWHLQGTPLPLLNLRVGIVQYAVWWLRILGVSKIMVKQTMLGLRSVCDVSFKSMVETPPDDLKSCRNTMIRLLADTITMVGILEVEIVPDEKEMKEITDFWKKIQEPPQTQDKKEIKLNTEVDPTGDKVIDDGSTTTTTSDTTPAAEPPVEPATEPAPAAEPAADGVAAAPVG